MRCPRPFFCREMDAGVAFCRAGDARVRFAGEEWTWASLSIGWATSASVLCARNGRGRRLACSRRSPANIDMAGRFLAAKRVAASIIVQKSTSRPVLLPQNGTRHRYLPPASRKPQAAAGTTSRSRHRPPSATASPPPLGAALRLLKEALEDELKNVMEHQAAVEIHLAQANLLLHGKDRDVGEL